MKAFFGIALSISLLASVIAQESSSASAKFKEILPGQWIQTDEHEFVRFTQSAALIQIELANDDTAVGKITEYIGAPQLKPVLTVKSKAAVSRLKEKLSKEGNWFPATLENGKNGFIRWTFVGRVTVIPHPNEPAQKALKVTHITNSQPLQLGVITDPKLVKDLLNSLERDK